MLVRYGKCVLQGNRLLKDMQWTETGLKKVLKLLLFFDDSNEYRGKQLAKCPEDMSILFD